MKKINLEEAKEILKNQGYEIELDLKEAFKEQFWVEMDSRNHLLETYDISDITNQKGISKFISMHKKELEDYCFKQFSDNDAISEMYLAIIERAVSNLLNEELSKFKINPLSNDIYIRREAEEAVKYRQTKRYWYVLHYNPETTEYLNKIEFLTFREAAALFLGSEPLCKEDRVELMFAPDEDDDEDFGDNIVVAWKIMK